MNWFPNRGCISIRLWFRLAAVVRFLPRRLWLCTGIGVLASISRFDGATLNTLYAFGGNLGEGASPQAGLIQGSDGDFYGTTPSGGAFSSGTIFKMTAAGAVTTLYSFSQGGNLGDGQNPTAGLVQGSDGNFYGTTYGNSPGPNGSTIFKITPAGVLTTLYRFSGSDGANPHSGLIQGSDGNFYGTTESGGTSDKGTIFKMTSSGVLTTLYRFSGSDGATPVAGLIQGSDGNFYGTTLVGGTSTGTVSGTIFRITPGGTLTTLYNFSGGNDGGGPQAGLIQNSDGDFYGTAAGGGGPLSGYRYGTVFKITPAGTLTTLHTFSGSAGHGDSNGAFPYAGLIQSSDGNFYGTTTGGGICNTGCTSSGGTVFKITPTGALTTLYRFAGVNGARPQAGLIHGSDGNFYGTTSGGNGTCFKITSVGTLTTLRACSLATAARKQSIRRIDPGERWLFLWHDCWRQHLERGNDL